MCHPADLVLHAAHCGHPPCILALHCQGCPGMLYSSMYIGMEHSVKEYERAVIFRLGRLLSGGARGPGVFFIIPCVDIYEKIDMRTATFEIPPQEVSTNRSS